MTATFMYFLAIFSYGLDGDFSGSRSVYPARMFTLPVTSSALVGWPMLYGSAAMVLLWVATRFLGIWPPDADVPVIWPLLLGPSLLAWTQALAWMPYPAAGLRPIAMVLWLATIDAIVMIALYYRPPTHVMLAVLAPHVPLAFLVARAAVKRARAGGGQAILPVRTGKIASPPRPFPSAKAAQFWFEWRQHGRALPALVAMLLPFEIAMLFVFADFPVIVMEIVVVVLTTPPLMAVFTAPSMSRPTPFDATRPLSSASLIGGKLKMAIASTAAAWGLVLIALPLGLQLSGTMSLLVDRAREEAEIIGAARACAGGILLIAFLVMTTWKQLMQSLYVGMSGRDWAIKASVFATLTLLAIAAPLLHWIAIPIATILYAFPWIAAAFIVIKIATGAWIVMQLEQRLQLIVALCWNVAVFAVYAILVWMLPEMVVRGYVLALVAILAVPLVRISAAPVMLERSRHR